MIVADHDAGAFDSQFAGLALLDRIAFFIDDLGFPAITGFADGTDFVNVFNAQMYAAGSDGLGKAVVGIILMIREVILPVFDQTLGNRLGTDVHQPPLIQLVILQLQLAVIDGQKKILCPRNQQPYDGAFLLGHGLQDEFRARSFQEDSLAAGEKTSEPVHLGAGVIEGRDAQEHVVPVLAVMSLFHFAGVRQGTMLMQDGLREAGGTGGEIDGSFVVIGQSNVRAFAGAVRHMSHIVFCEAGAAVSNEIKQTMLSDLVSDAFHTADELRTEDQDIDIRQIQTVLDLIRSIPEIQRNSQSAGFQDTEIDREPFEAVHQKNGNLVAFFDSTGEQKIGKTVRFLIEDAPCDLSAVVGGAFGLDQVIFLPGDSSRFGDLGVDLYQSDFIAVEICVSFQQFCDGHDGFLSLFRALTRLFTKAHCTPFSGKVKEFCSRVKRTFVFRIDACSLIKKRSHSTQR